MSPIREGDKIPKEFFDQFDLSDVELHLVGEGTYLDSNEVVDGGKNLHAEVKVSGDYDIFNISKVKL